MFNWFIFPAPGYVYGYYFIRAKDKSQFFKFWQIFLIFALAYFIFSMFHPNGFLSSDIHLYYFMTTLDVLFCLIYIPGNIGLCLWLSKILPDSVNKIFSIFSANINMIYIIQWFIIPIAFILIVYANRIIIFADWMMILISIAC
ncbi:hypothetical protein [Methanobrevibacter sp.]